MSFQLLIFYSHLVTNQTACFLTGLHEDGFNVILFGGASLCDYDLLRGVPQEPRHSDASGNGNGRSSDAAFQAPAWPGLVDDRLPRCFGERGNWAGVFHLKAV